ncbi:MAG: hypothetical protein IPP47_03650 [Bryobacterales bacterium]|nr:hypothetical protein [Bryobacterales bacterium]
MRLIRSIGSTTALLLFGAVVPAYTQPDKHDEKRDKPDQRQERGEQQRQRPPQSRQDARPQEWQRQQHQQRQRPDQQARAWQERRGWAQQGGGWQGRGTWEQGRARRWESEHRSWAQRGGYGGYYIPQSSFSLNFGSQNSFRMQGRPTMYMGYPRFNYRGFSFLMVDPWPEYWQQNWYENDDVYIDYDGGYYLHNRRHPGVRLAITVAM